MKLLSCYIENFGALKQFEYQFEGGFVQIHKENGKGKTTLAAFVLAMLYGMETHSKRDAEQKARNRYDPWQGGKYGGRLTLESCGQVYRIERIFDSVSATKDQSTVFDDLTGKVLFEEEQQPGYVLLGMTKEAFLASAFLSGKDHGSITEIIPRLDGYLEGIEGTDRYEQASKILSDAIKDYEKQRGSGGKIGDVKKEIKSANDRLSYIRQAAENAERYQRQLFDLQKEYLPKRQRLKFLNEHAAKIERLKVLKDYEQKLEEAKERYALFCKTYGEEYPDEQALKDFEKDVARLGELLKDAEKSEKDRKEEAYVWEHEALFSKVTQKDLQELSKKALLLTTVKEQLDSFKNRIPSPEDDLLHQRFDKKFPSEEDVALLQQRNKSYESAKFRLEEFSVTAGQKGSKYKKAATVCAVCSVIFLFVALASMILSPVLSIPFVLPSLLLATIGAILFYLSKKKPENPAENEYRELDILLREHLRSYGYKEPEPSEAISLLLEDRKAYLALCQKEEEQQREKASLLQKQSNLEKELTLYFDALSLSEGSFEQRIDYLSRELALYAVLSKNVKDSAQKREDKAKEYQKSKDVLLARLSIYFKETEPVNDPLKSVEDLKKIGKARQELLNALSSREKDLCDYRENNDLSLPECEVFPTPEERAELQRQVEELEGKMAKQNSKLEEELEVSAELPEAEARIVNLHEKLDTLTDRKRILEKTAEFLKEARDDLSNRYTLPIRKAYEEYTAIIDSSLSEGLSISPDDFSMHFERNGALRKNANFNSAFVTLSNICMRLAVLKVAYPAERPFLVLDDPFVYLDDDNCKKALNALKELSKDTQILYFTCHSGRTLNEKTPL